ncbi:DUF2892 domain-containing protein [Alsobacter sp. SYSU M60028]|uniref:DUF2892 domain-containing protein n=1 Tax=Alsobacter ponti TaxID=2962936 RepID=A0ABT1L7V8_9HYPH|nr:DUF2892 domain-containing protein [Alsobacter ponti]MCP8937078.1 DUF2892 domain-containing protein [Alsobacter ponti]
MSDIAHQAQDVAADLWEGMTSGPPNVGDVERIASTVMGLGLLAWGLRQGGTSGMLAGLAGVMLTTRGATGYCPAYAAMDSAGDDEGMGHRPDTLH